MKNISKALFLLISFCFFSCVTGNFDSKSIPLELTNDIVILYENDAHCNVSGYEKLSGLKNQLLQEGKNVAVVSSGDFIQGGSLGAISEGEYIIDIMNLIEYDAVALGNHEFDYKIPRLLELSDLLTAPIVCSNFIKLEDNQTVFSPYTIATYEDVDVAYIGITTPSTISNSFPIQFFNNGEYAYSFSSDNLFSVVQNSIDEAKKEGADIIILLSHLGTEDVLPEWSSIELVKNTYGADVVLDGHSHSVVEQMLVKDKKNNDVIISSTGTQFENIGKLTISTKGEINTELISVDTLTTTDEEVSNYIEKINQEYSILGQRLIGESKVDLITHDENGNRIIRTEETNLGDFCADAFRIVTDSDIGVINGGGIRRDIKKGNVTFNDILNVFPWNNTVCVAEVTGQQIVDFLELASKEAPNEFGSFQHVSGLKFQIDTSIPSSVICDENEVFIKVDGKYRVSNVKVLNKETMEYEDISLEKKYTLASHHYLLKEKGSGASMLDGSKLLVDNGMLDVELLEIYIKDYLGGTISSEYNNPQDRILILQ